MSTRVVTSALLLFAIALPTLAQEEKLKDLKGTIRLFDAKTGQINIKSQFSETVLALSLASKDIAVTNTLGEKLKLTDVREELRVTAKIRGEDEVAALRIDGPYLYGVIKRIDVDERVVLLKDVFGEKSIKVPEAAKVIISGEPGSLKDCKVGGGIQFLTTLDKKKILQVHAGKGIQGRDPLLRVTRFQGMLVEIDHARRQVQMVVQNTDAGLIKTHDVSPDAYLRLLYHLKPIEEVGFDQFAKWVKVYYFVDRDTNRIVNIDAELPVMIRRKVIKLEGQSLTVEDELKEKNLTLAANVKVLTPKGEGRLKDVAANRIVNCGLSLDRSRVLVVYLWDR
jgi:hypothetical protein